MKHINLLTAILLLVMSQIAYADVCYTGKYTEKGSISPREYNPTVDKCVEGRVILVSNDLCAAGRYTEPGAHSPMLFTPTVDKCVEGRVIGKNWEICEKTPDDCSTRATAESYTPNTYFCKFGRVTDRMMGNDLCPPNSRRRCEPFNSTGMDNSAKAAHCGYVYKGN